MSKDRENSVESYPEALHPPSRLPLAHITSQPPISSGYSQPQAPAVALPCPSYQI